MFHPRRASDHHTSRRHVVGVVAAVAVQHEVSARVIHGGVVGHVRGAIDQKSNALAVRDGIADHRATLADYHPRGSDPEGVIAVYDAGGGNPDTPTGGAGNANGIAPHDPVGDYATFARAGAVDAQSLNDRTDAPKIYPVTKT